jgi:hypothetical protein
MLDLIWGKKKEPVAIKGEFADKIKDLLKNKLCSHCNKMPSTELAFGLGIQNASFTCKNCELKAVGGSIQRLG